MAIPGVMANFTTSLAAKISSSASSLTINRSTDDDSNTLAAQYLITVDEGTSTEEHMIVTFAGSAGTINTRGLSRVDAVTNKAANQFAHDRGASVKITDMALVRVVRRLNGTEAFDSVAWTGVASIAGLSTPTSGELTKAANVQFVVNTAIAGAVDASEVAKGIVELATSAESIAGTDTGSTSAYLMVRPSYLARNQQNGSFIYAASTTGNDTYVITLVPAITAYANGQVFIFKPDTANTGAATLNVNTLGAKTIKKFHDQDLETGDIEANQIVVVAYNSTADVFELQSPVATQMTTAIATEASNFFGSTDITGAEAETLSSGATSNADSLHTHPAFSRGYSVSFSNATQARKAGSNSASGFSDSSPDLIALGTYNSGGDAAGSGTMFVRFAIATDYGISLYPVGQTTHLNVIANISFPGVVYIGSNYWNVSSANTIYKGGSSVTIASGGGVNGPLGHDATNSYLLMLTSTTNIRRWSGISGTTITQVDNITLDTAVTATVGFMFDDTNDRYICVDTSANVVRRFNSSGTTIDTVSYTIDDTVVCGVVAIGGRVHLVCQISSDDYSSGYAGVAHTTFIPTTMTL